MRNVDRIQEPQSFRDNAPAWAQALRRKIGEGKASDYYYDRYNQKNAREIRNDMEDSLLAMYSAMCCYCEAKTRKKQGEIEHLRPKKKFPDRTYDWTNLHWICCECNGSKLEKFDDAHPILDPSDAEPIDQHVGLEIDDETMWLWLLNRDHSARGYTTIEHAQLNRDVLKTARMKIYLKTLKLIQEVRRTPAGSQKLNMIKNTLRNLYIGEFGFITSVKAAFEITGFTYDEL